ASSSSLVRVDVLVDAIIGAGSGSISKYDTYACNSPLALNLGKQIGSQLAELPLTAGDPIVASKT
ncbi:6649_t:CDS:1, partial [Acaulospora colombiana]